MKLLFVYVNKFTTNYLLNQYTKVVVLCFFNKHLCCYKKERGDNCLNQDLQDLRMGGIFLILQLTSKNCLNHDL